MGPRNAFPRPQHRDTWTLGEEGNKPVYAMVLSYNSSKTEPQLLHLDKFLASLSFKVDLETLEMDCGDFILNVGDILERRMPTTISGFSSMLEKLEKFSNTQGHETALHSYVGERVKKVTPELKEQFIYIREETNLYVFVSHSRQRKALRSVQGTPLGLQECDSIKSYFSPGRNGAHRHDC
mgnify:CR=1 FL=1